MTSQESNIQKLENYGEIRGNLRGLKVDQWLLSASIGDYNIALPPEMEDKLRPLVGKRIGILHTDVPAKEFLIRDLSADEAKKQDALAVNPIVSRSNNVAGEVI